MATVGECDSCRAKPRLLHAGVACGCEGAFCTECRRVSLAEDIDELEEMLEEAATEDRRDILLALEEARGAVEPRKTLSDGTQIYPEHRNLKPNGQQQGYVVLAEEERAKGFVRPVRRSYRHLKCGGITTMSQTIAETYARDPSFYSGTFCCGCGAHFPVGHNGEFVWDGSNEKVGT